MTGPYPLVEPYATGRLDVGDGHALYWEACGRPDGTPAVVLHGGPGSGAGPPWRTLFDPERYRVVLFDQRGCGRSTPDAGADDRGLEANTTHHLVGDIERLRIHIGVDRWLVLGASWGSVLALAYGQRHPERVSAMVLFSVATGAHAEIEWITRGVGRYFPAEWRRFLEHVPEAERGGDLTAAYARLLTDPDPALRAAAARSWCAWEETHMGGPDPRYGDPAFRLRFARLVTHYWRHAAWLRDGELLDGAAALAGIPGVLIHGRLDLSSPLEGPWRLAQRWPDAELTVIEGEGHTGGDALFTAVIAALDRFAA